MSAESGPLKSWGGEGDLGQLQRDSLVALLNNNISNSTKIGKIGGKTDPLICCLLFYCGWMINQQPDY